MLKLLSNWYTRPYTSEHVKLALNFMLDAQKLFQMEHSEDFGENGFGGYLRVNCMKGGINSYSTLRYMKKRFAEFTEITNVCEGIESKFKEYDERFWDIASWSLENQRKNKGDIMRLIMENRVPVKYLEQFLPLEDIAYILSKP